MTSSSALMDERPDAVLIAGPTASGKSGFALELAEKHKGTIVNTDSMQVYPLLRVLTARPPDEDLARAPHVLYGHASLEEAYSVARWLDDVQAELENIRQEDRIPVFVGGTGLYFKALSEGLVKIPDIPATVRNYWRKRLEEDGLAVLFSELEKRDAQAATNLRANDRQRILRALEVVDATGRSILDHQAAGNSEPVLDVPRVEKYLLSPPREQLHQRINQRFDWMVDKGALDEVMSLGQHDIMPDHPVLKAIGVVQLREFFGGNLSREEALEKSKTATRQYAKRQSTWFRNQLGDEWRVVD